MFCDTNELTIRSDGTTRSPVSRVLRSSCVRDPGGAGEPPLLAHPNTASRIFQSCGARWRPT
eukprot:2588522-Pyramimonas_sp.AAC.1